MRTWVRAGTTGIAGGAAWIAGMWLFFGPAQQFLASPVYQSGKFLAVLTQMEPLPRTAEHRWILFAGTLVIGLVYGLVFSVLYPTLPGKGVGKGVTFGIVAWALMAPWFEFYLPWNVMREPFALALLELLLWALVFQLVGIAMALVYRVLTPKPRVHTIL
jgi:hypothetical protein